MGVEHLLLGLLRAGDGVGYQVLTDLGVTLDGARAALQRHLETLATAEERSTDAPSPTSQPTPADDAD